MENNIFDYATVKEFSQDIAITWLINCYNYKETRDIGKYFIEKFIFNEKEKVDNVIQVKPQYRKIDVYAEIETKENIYRIIIENKKDTFLHDDQMKKYIKKIIDEKRNNDNSKTEKILFILFKSGILAPYEELMYEKQKELCQNDFEKDLEIKNLELNISNIKNTEEFRNALKKDTNNYLLNLIIDAYNKQVKSNKENKNWIYKKSKEEWNSFITEIINELDNESIKFSENHFVRGIYRTDFDIKDEEFLNISNRIIPNCNWGYCIDWNENTEIKFFLNGPEGYKQYSKVNMSAEDRNFVERRMDIIDFLKSKIKEKDDLRVGDKKIRTFSIVLSTITSENMSSKNVINKVIFMKEKVESILKEYISEER